MAAAEPQKWPHLSCHCRTLNQGSEQLGIHGMICCAADFGEAALGLVPTPLDTKPGHSMILDDSMTCVPPE
jgi:hypothetical protein